MKKRLLAALAALLFAASLLALPGRAEAAAAKDITKQCKFAVSSSAASARRLADGKLSTLWRSAASAGQYVDVTWKSGLTPGGLYIRWNAPPQGWALTGYDGAGAEAARLEGGADGFLAEYVTLPADFAGCGRIRLSSPDPKGIAVVELSVFGEGSAPYWAPVWQPFEGRADVMVVSAHPDDDVLYLGAVIPVCAEQGKSAVTVTMTYGKPLRRYEAMEGSWIEGERVQPVYGPFPDTYSVGSDKALRKTWPEEKALAFLVGQIRKYKPSVIVTHDANGEYGHGAHLWTSALVRKAFEQAGDAALFPDSAAAYGAWNAAKLYLHLYKQNRLTLDTRAPLAAYGGKTAFDTAKLAYTRHVSQHVWSFEVRDAGSFSIRSFGLAATRVGQGAGHRDMFENVTDEAMLALNPGHLYSFTDRSALTASIARAETLRREDFSSGSWAAAGLPGAVEAAKTALEDRQADQPRLDAATSALDDAAASLEAGRLTGLSVEGRRIYFVGEKLDSAGLAVTATYRDGTTEILPADRLTVSGFDSTAPAIGQAVTVTAGGQSASFVVDVLDWRALILRVLRLFGFLRMNSAG